jgi:hypothetical protein
MLQARAQRRHDEHVAGAVLYDHRALASRSKFSTTGSDLSHSPLRVGMASLELYDGCVSRIRSLPGTSVEMSLENDRALSHSNFGIASIFISGRLIPSRRADARSLEYWFQL